MHLNLNLNLVNLSLNLSLNLLRRRVLDHSMQRICDINLIYMSSCPSFNTHAPNSTQIRAGLQLWRGQRDRRGHDTRARGAAPKPSQWTGTCLRAPLHAEDPCNKFTQITHRDCASRSGEQRRPPSIDP